MGRVSLLSRDWEGLTRTRTLRQSDARGMFGRLYCALEFESLSLPTHFEQINYSHTIGQGALRGLHYQDAPQPDGKYVRCLEGQVYDVAVDLRCGSATFLQWRGFVLDGAEGDALYLPPGFAHGFQVLSKEARLIYLHTSRWDPELDRGLRHDDPSLDIQWPLRVTQLSARDQGFDFLGSHFTGVSL